MMGRGAILVPNPQGLQNIGVGRIPALRPDKGAAADSDQNIVSE